MLWEEHLLGKKHLIDLPFGGNSPNDLATAITCMLIECFLFFICFDPTRFGKKTAVIRPVLTLLFLIPFGLLHAIGLIETGGIMFGVFFGG
jgi:hypothetical protein